jgi:hypothetical protein
MRTILHRVGVLEAVLDEHKKADEKLHEDIEERMRKQEHLTAKVVGGAIVGSTLGAWILSQLSACIG